MRTHIAFLYTIILLILGHNSLAAQTTQTGTQIILNQADNGNKVYQARERIILKPQSSSTNPTGYTYSPGGVSTNKMLAKINASQVFDVSYATAMYNNATFGSRTIDVNLAVGTISGSASVSDMGAASYTIPISLPPGTSGMSPQLALIYNSLSGDGQLGMGWSLSGLSMITRSGRDIYHDGKTSPPQFQSADSDPFVLDGQRLIATNGTYGASGTTYSTEAESFTRITSNGTQNYGPLWFKVEHKNGLTMEFGNTSDSRFTDEETFASVICWRLNKIYDAYGNYILFKYKNDLRESRIDEISFTGNDAAGITPYNSIKFFYDNRFDANTTYVQGSAIKNQFLLTSIHIRAENGVFKTYNLTYGKDPLHSYLQEVSESGTDESKLNTTVFKYMGFDSDVISRNTNDLPATPSGSAGVDLLPGDYNGDGLTDIAYLPYQITGNGLKYNTKLKVFVSKLNGWPNDPFHEGPNSIDFSTDQFANVKGIDYPPLRQMYSNDFDGDGTDNIWFVKQVAQSNGDLHLEQINIYKVGYDGTLTYTTSDFATDPFWRKIDPTKPYIAVADFDGDGRSDYFTYLRHAQNNSLLAFLNFPGKNEINNTVSFGSYSTLCFDDKFIPVDYDGDGKSELMCVGNQGSCIWSFSKNTSTTYNATVLYEGLPNKDYKIFPGDFNKDGKTDLLVQSNAGVWQIYLSKGKNGFAISGFTLNQTYDPNFDNLTIGDFNGDGLSDIRHYYTTGSGTAMIGKNDLYYSKGGANFYYIQHQTLADGFPLSGTGTRGDFNGDGREDVLVRNGQSNVSVRGYFFNEFDRGTLLEKVANGYNHVTSFAYVELSQKVNYEKGIGSTYPLNDICPALPVVREMSVQNGIGSWNTTKFAYKEARVHLGGRGFIGYKFTARDASSPDFEYITRMEQNYELLAPNSKYYVNLPKESYTKSVKLNALTGALIEENFISSLTNIWALTEFGGLRYWPKLTGSSQKNFLSGATVTENFTYDATNYGNLTQSISTAKSSESASSFIEKTTIDLSAYNSNGSWLPNKPGQIITTKEREGQPSKATTTTYTYNAKGSLITQVDFSGQPKALTTTKTYDSNVGFLSSEQVSATGLTARSKSYGYDPKGRFQISSTNSLNQSVYSEYNPAWGKPIKVTGVDGLVSLYEYDGFGSLKKTTTPEGNVITTSWNWAVSSNQVYYTHTAIPGRPDAKVWYDKLNREIKSHTEGFAANDWIEKVTTYDCRGNVKTTTSPHFQNAGTATYITSINTYDDKYNRLNKTASEFGETIYTYESTAAGTWTVKTRTPDLLEKTVTTDAAGKTISSSDFSGAMLFTYDSWGNQIQASNGATALTKMKFDDYGRQTELEDIDAGKTLYDYNAYGELISQTNPKTQQTTMTYDVLGRILTRVEPFPNGTTSYEYFAAGNNGVSQIKKITNFNGITEEFTYDGFSRVLTSKTTVDGTAHTKTFGYNNFGDNTSVTYPSGFGIQRTFTDRGYLQSVINAAGTKVLYVANQMDALGNFYNFTLADGKTCNNSYDKYGYPDLFATPGVQNLDFTFDVPTGNLLGRNDLIAGKNETFSFNNNRLASNSVNGTLVHSIAYDNNANITSKTDAGSFTYNAAKIHAVESVSSTANYSAAVQNVTYNWFEQPVTLSEGNFQLDFTYRSDYQRIKSVLKESNVVKNTRYFLGDYEIDANVVSGVTTTRHLHYISGNDGLDCIVVRENGTDQYYAVYKDYLGSILAVTTKDANNNLVITRQNFDPWGRYRDPVSFAHTSTAGHSLSWLYRGYTGHEHLSNFGLINMNGRLYDPVAGRMLSPDNFVQDALSLQGYNRYAYALNNPLKYADPDGEWVHIVAGALVGGFINGIAHADHGVKGFLTGFAIGAAAGAITAATGGAFAVYATTGSLVGATSSTAVAAASSGFFGGAAMGFGGSVLGSAYLGIGNMLAFGDPYSVQSYAKDIVLNTATSGLLSGTVSGLTGNNFFTGKPPGGWGWSERGIIDKLTREEIADAAKDGIVYNTTTSAGRAASRDGVRRFVTTDPLIVYRSVDLSEYQAILKNEAFTPGEGYSTGKLFARNYSDAKMYNSVFENGFIVKAKVPAGIQVEQVFGTDGLDFIYNVPVESLSKIKIITIHHNF